VLTSKPVCEKLGIEGALPAHDLNCGHPHPPRSSVSPPMSLMSSVRMTSASVSSSEESCLSKRKDNLGAAEGKRGSGALGEGFEKQC
jgi:hypothetical protein